MNETVRMRIASDKRRIEALKVENERYRKQIDYLRMNYPNSSSIKEIENCIKNNLKLIAFLQEEIDYDKNRNSYTSGYTSSCDNEYTSFYDNDDYPSSCTRYDDEYPCTW